MLTSATWRARVLLALAGIVSAHIDRHAPCDRLALQPRPDRVEQQHPLQVGNGHCACGADVTGLQTFLPFTIMSNWGWKNDSLPDGTTEADLEAYHGETRDGVTYLFEGAEPLQDWVFANPNRANLGRVGLMFMDEADAVVDLAEGELEGTTQTLDLWTGTMTSSFRWQGGVVVVQTTAAQSSDAVGLTVALALLGRGRLDIFLDFPWNSGNESFYGIQAPFVGFWNELSKHTTSLTTGPDWGRSSRQPSCIQW
ncbi:hypothetical protein LXA43DRAFT_23066 [Ganoderma leucocontextum]|nr:hypothetical protein LXA43DRAFT_23066 [Ganoderma leucocontextum]